jgi:hypothetical protein
MALVIGGLLIVAAGLAGLAFAYWRTTRPAPAPTAEGSAATIGVVPVRPAAATASLDALLSEHEGSGPASATPVAAAAAPTAASAEGLADLWDEADRPVEPVPLERGSEPVTAQHDGATEPALSTEGLEQLWADTDQPVEPVPPRPDPETTAAPAPDAPAPGTDGRPEASPTHGVRIIGPVSPFVTREDLGLADPGSPAPGADGQA